MIYNVSLNDYKKECSSCTICIISFTIFLSITISSVFIYFHWYLKRNDTNAKTALKINLNRPCYFFSSMTNIRNLDPNLASINKISYKNTDAAVYNIKYIMMESINNQNIDSKNPHCLVFNNVDAYIIEESNENK